MLQTGIVASHSMLQLNVRDERHIFPLCGRNQSCHKNKSGDLRYCLETSFGNSLFILANLLYQFFILFSHV